MLKIDLSKQIKLKGGRRKEYTIATASSTKAQQQALARLYIKVIAIWRRAAQDRIMPVYRLSLGQAISQDQMLRDSVNDLDDALNRSEDEAKSGIQQFIQLFGDWISWLGTAHMVSWINRVRQSTGVDLQYQINQQDVYETVEQMASRNASLIRNVSDEIRAKIADSVLRGLQARTPARDVAKEINALLQGQRNRSMRIAIDQTQKLYSALEQQRQRQAGTTGFKWRHSGKLHYRPEHKARDGEYFAWESDVARTDPPGFAPFCGCLARGVIRVDDGED